MSVDEWDLLLTLGGRTSCCLLPCFCEHGTEKPDMRMGMVRDIPKTIAECCTPPLASLVAVLYVWLCSCCTGIHQGEFVECPSVK